MSCPTCDHTMKNMAAVEYLMTVFWCTRCGTIKIRDDESDEGIETEVPMDAKEKYK